jgi:hypothetical protein
MVSRRTMLSSAAAARARLVLLSNSFIKASKGVPERHSNRNDQSKEKSTACGLP